MLKIIRPGFLFRNQENTKKNSSLFCTLLDPKILFLLEIGGGERDRTDDLVLAKHALSQLSYTPI